MYSTRNKERRGRSKGFTLIEVLVASSVSLLLGLTVLQVFTQSSHVLNHAITRVDLIQRTRIPADRLTQYLNAAVGLPTLDAIVYPNISASADPLEPNLEGNTIFDDDPTTWDRMIVIRTTEDFLATAGTVGYEFDPEAIMDVEDIKNNLNAWETDQQRLTEYVIWYEDEVLDLLPNKSNVLAMARLDDLILSEARDATWVKAWYARLKSDPTSDLEPGLAPFIIATNIQDVRFRRRANSGIQVSITASEDDVKTVSGARETKTLRYDAVIQCPTIQMNF